MRRWLGITFTASAIALFSLPASAAQYKWIGADGRVNYSDRQPPHDAQQFEGRNAAPSDANASLPYALRQAATKYPVLLYTSSGCEPCDAARAQLVKRGVPFAEFTLRNQADADAYQKAGFDGKTVPGIKVGRQITSGFQASSIDALLDAAGYPKSATLPAQFVRPSARALTGDGATSRSASNAPVGDGALRDPQALGAGADIDDGQGQRRPTGAAASAPATAPATPQPVPAAGPNPNFRF